MNKTENSSAELSMLEALIAVIVLMSLLAYNIFFEDGVLFGDYSNQYILLFSAIIALVIGVKNKISLQTIFIDVQKNLKSIVVPVGILFLVGALAGTWLISGVIPAMVYYGLQVLNPSFFLPSCVIIASIVSVATGSSWTTSATVGIALVGIGTTLGIQPGMIAGAVISGSYFGDKMSPLSDTTNLAAAVSGAEMFSHIKYMALTTIPTMLITLLIFSLLSFFITAEGTADVASLLSVIDHTFYISPWLFLVPGTVIVLIITKVKPLIALSSGVAMAIIFAVFFQSKLLSVLDPVQSKIILQSILTDVQIQTDNASLNELFSSGGMNGMLWTIALIISAMIFGGIMEGIGALSRITDALLKLASSVFGLFTSTVLSCLGLNIIASDQYLAIVIPGKMYKQAFEDKGLAPENLSRTLEDSGTVTSVLIPWNSCGAYESGVLGVPVSEFFMFAIFNYLSPIMTLFYAFFQIKIKTLVTK